MGILDDLTSTFNKGAAAAERGVKTVKLRAQIGDLEKQRQEFCAQLGASLYEVTKDDSSFREGRESLYNGIDSCDAERNTCLRLIEEIEQQAVQDAAACEMLTCTVCGSVVNGNDSFCSGCGTSVEQIRNTTSITVMTASSDQETVCASCGHPVSPSDSFCVECGAKVA